MKMVEVHGRSCSSETVQSEEEMELRRGPWTLEEDLLLMNYIATHGEGRWNLLARCAGLKRTGKSCRLRWLNYLRPDVRRGNITPEEQLLILDLHSRWGNRWSRIAQHLPGRTDNEIKNYWRTRVQKHAKHLQCDVDSKQFKDVMRYLWIPRLIERIQAGSSYSPPALPPAEYGIVPGDCDRTCANVESWNVAESTAESSSSSWKSAKPSTLSSGSSAAGFQAAEKRKAGDGIMDTPWPDVSQGLPELEHYWGQEGDNISDNFWNAEDIWYLQS